MAELPEEDRNPETAAITGGAPAAAEPSPQMRGREATARSSVYVYAGLGLLLLVVSIFADQDSNGTLGTIVAGVALLALAGMRVTGVIGPALTAVLGFVAGIALTIVAFSATDFGGAQLVLVVSGAATFIVSFASLAATRQRAPAAEETPGVENV